MRHGYEKWIVMRIGQYGSGIAFSQGVEKGSLAEVDNTTTTTTLHYVDMQSSKCCKMLEDASLRQARLSPSFWHSAVQFRDMTRSFDTNAYLVQI